MLSFNIAWTRGATKIWISTVTLLAVSKSGRPLLTNAIIISSLYYSRLVGHSKSVFAHFKHDSEVSHCVIWWIRCPCLRSGYCRCYPIGAENISQRQDKIHKNNCLTYAVISKKRFSSSARSISNFPWPTFMYVDNWCNWALETCRQAW